jgi:hypothetical protein
MKVIYNTTNNTAVLHLEDCKINAEAVSDLYWAACAALADLEGIMPEFEPSGDREHPGWQTIKELKAAIKKAKRKELP